jgi:hypothetical protein
MLRTRAVEVSLWEAVLPEEVLRLPAELARFNALRRIAEQTRQRLSGTTPDGATRWVSLHDGDARPIAKGRLGRPVQFGY